MEAGCDTEISIGDHGKMKHERRARGLTWHFL